MVISSFTMTNIHSRKFKQIFHVLLIIIAMSASLFASQKAIRIKYKNESINNLPEIKLGLPVENIMSAGFGGFASSLAWVDAIFTYSEILFDSASPTPLINKFAFSSNLDTLWPHPRLIASWAIPTIKSLGTKDALPFLEDGSFRFPQEWRFRITWAQYILSDHTIDSVIATDSAAKILLPLATLQSNIPAYVRDLAFTLLHKNGKHEQAMNILLQIYSQIPDPLIRFQFQSKIADLLHRNNVQFQRDSTAFLQCVANMLDSKDTEQVSIAKTLLIRLVQPKEKELALAQAHHLARQFQSYQDAQVGGGR